jgi:hypothetical protein
MVLERQDIFGLHEFAQGAVDFLVGAAALSVVIGLIASALDDVTRPSNQHRIFLEWLAGGFDHDDKVSASSEGASRGPGAELGFRDFLFLRLKNLPPPFFALQPDQLCAQVIRRLQTGDADAEGQPGWATAPSPLKDDYGWARWGERSENAVDDLQAGLARSAVLRSYTSAASIAVGFGLLMYGLEPPSLDGPVLSLLRMFTLTAVFGGVAVLLSPIVQSLIARFLRPR